LEHAFESVRAFRVFRGQLDFLGLRTCLTWGTIFGLAGHIDSCSFLMILKGMQMNKKILIMLAAVSSGSALAVDFEDTARVVGSKAVIERVSEPKQECWNETVTSTGIVTRSTPVEEHSIGGALLGGLIGGVVGSQIGQGNGSTIATGAGAIAGAIIGDRVANKDAPQQTTQVPQMREERHCRQIENYRDVIRGYDVTYRYNGHDATIRMSSQPGETVRVGVSVLGNANVSDVPAVRGNEGWGRDNRDRRHGEGRRGD
jgi:uncharacterized protein YcfJ